MSGINKAIIIGNVGSDPELNQTFKGQSVCNINVATSDKWHDKETGEHKEKTEWHRICIFGRLAEIADTFLEKGSKVYIEGKLQTRSWDGEHGEKHYTTEIIVSGFNGVMQMLDKKEKMNKKEKEEDIPF